MIALSRLRESRRVCQSDCDPDSESANEGLLALVAEPFYRLLHLALLWLHWNSTAVLAITSSRISGGSVSTFLPPRACRSSTRGLVAPHNACGSNASDRNREADAADEFTAAGAGQNHRQLF